MRVRFDAEKCLGHGRCYVLAPETFDEDERGYCIVLEAEVPPAHADSARRGAQNCPEHALTVED